MRNTIWGASARSRVGMIILLVATNGFPEPVSKMRVGVGGASNRHETPQPPSMIRQFRYTATAR
jgi:hypothetical protein